LRTGQRSSLTRSSDSGTLSAFRKELTVSGIIILVIAVAAGIGAYYGGGPTPPSAQVTTDGCSPQGVQLVLPPDVSTVTGAPIQPPTLTLVIGANNTMVWNDQDPVEYDTVVSSVVPQGALQWDIEGMTAGNTYCVTLPVPGTYFYKIDTFILVEILVKSAQ
jgi:hypothetical protein